MSTYIEQSLGKDEVLILTSRIHWATFILRVILSLIIFRSIAPFNILIAVIVVLIILLPPIVRIYATNLAFTNKKVLGKIGIINTKSLDAPLNKINNVSVSSGLGGKIFGYGTIIITTSSGAYSFKGIADANAFKTNLMAQINQFDEDRIKKQAMEMAQAMKN